MNKKYKLRDKILFYIYNIIFNSSLIYFVFFYIVLAISMFIGSSCTKQNIVKNINSCDGLIIYSFLISIILFEIFFLIIKFISLPMIYKCSKNDFFKQFLEHFITTNNKKRIIILYKILIGDIIIWILNILIISIIITIFITKNFQESIIYCSSIQFLFFGVLSFGGALPCYLSFLLWYKWTHRKKINTNN